MEQQELINHLIEFIKNEHRVPSADEFSRFLRIGKRKITDQFGTWTDFLAAAGIHNKKKIDQSIFERNIDQHLSKHKPPKLPDFGGYESTLFIPDVHFPFEHQETLKQIYDFAEKMQPKTIIQLGDLYDNFSHAKFPRSHNIFTPREEFNLSRKKAEQFWTTLQKKAPKAKCYQITGNHSIRPIKRILEVYPEAEDWITEVVQKMMRFDGVTSITDPREELMLPGNICVIHGYRSQLGSHRDFTMMNVVCGHTHRGGVVYRQVRNEIIWELNAGLAGDPTSKGLSYTSQKIVEWTLGWGWLDQWGPRFIPARKTK